MIKTALFIKSSADFRDCPATSDPEYAFIGRSNVGKSSLINMLCGRKSLAKTSSKPGKTQLINHFLINDQWYLVDLPGYGWSKVSKTTKAKWGKMIEDYLLNKENLSCLFVLLDSRLEPQDIDYNFMQWLGEKKIPFAIIFTKSDKLTSNKLQSVKAKHIKRLKAGWETLPDIFMTSAEKGTGGAEVLAFIEKVNKIFSSDDR